MVANEEPRFSLKHRGLVLSSIIQSVAFLESAINEILQDAADSHDTEKLSSVTDQALRAWGGLWEALEQGNTGSALRYYSAALISAGFPPFEQGQEPWQSAQLLVRLRNHLVHYKPATIYTDAPETLADGLRAKVTANPLSSNRAEVDGWLSAACADWAVGSAIALVEEFATRTGARPNYQLALNDLRTKNP